MKTIVVIPTYNEADNIVPLIESIKSALPSTDILIVDDNSPDGTAELVRKKMKEDDSIHLIVRQNKMGLGTAYCEGFKYALQQGYDYILQMDADFSHNPQELPRMVQEMKNADLVIGSRYISGVNVVNWPLSRLVLSYGANLYTRIITCLPVKDGTGGYKCFNAKYLKYIDIDQIRSNGYGFQIEMNYKMWKLGARIKEIPIIFEDRRSGKSKMNKSIVFEAMWLVWKLKFSPKIHSQLKKARKKLQSTI
ncbi:MAG TPA: polyprenol monophosphomannose synthase [Candidatus Kapabacteria bacterium]|jgi:dolichol-phosphate mannosyltransferase|nr:polyprenol monophosphomannose synthase [Candidatus Kapabacteria bacterium]HOV93153.1 polyprenol monophosphomannose synthase [Candidatus Kapabacteria bacterium]